MIRSISVMHGQQDDTFLMDEGDRSRLMDNSYFENSNFDQSQLDNSVVDFGRDTIDLEGANRITSHSTKETVGLVKCRFVIHDYLQKKDAGVDGADVIVDPESFG